MAELDDLSALARTIEPLPGGLAELRRRLREPRRSRVPIGLVAVAACAAAIAMCLLRGSPPVPADHSAMRALFGDQPNPRAVQLGLVEPARQIVASDPRVTT